MRSVPRPASFRTFLGLSAASLLLFLSACQAPIPPSAPSEPEAPAAPEPVPAPPAAAVTLGDITLAPLDFEALPACGDEDWDRALSAFRASCRVMAGRELWRQPCREAARAVSGREFFRSSFTPWQVLARVDGQLRDTGLMTGYYEPQLRGSRTRGGPYAYPLYGVPEDLITVDLVGLYPQLRGMRLRGKVVGQRLVPYDSRAEFTARADPRAPVLCWVDDPVDAFFLQIQGSGRVLLDDGTVLRLGYADQNGHPYRAIGSWLSQRGELPADSLSMQRIRRWAKEHPEKAREALNSNPRYVFFAERAGGGPDEGPMGAQSVPLTALASVAVDRRWWTLGLPFVVSAEQERPALRLTRPVIAQDTGGAIRGALRFDYFWGFGDAAGAQAGRQKSAARAWVLLPRGSHPRAALGPGSGAD